MLKGYRTLSFNALAFVPVLISLLQDPTVTPLIPPTWMPYVTMGIVIGNVLLRLNTTGPVGQK
jgi:hypothetical protein